MKSLKSQVTPKWIVILHQCIIFLIRIKRNIVGILIVQNSTASNHGLFWNFGFYSIFAVSIKSFLLILHQKS